MLLQYNCICEMASQNAVYSNGDIFSSVKRISQHKICTYTREAMDKDHGKYPLESRSVIALKHHQNHFNQNNAANFGLACLLWVWLILFQFQSPEADSFLINC
jgi:hypothetical protein